MKRQIVPGFYYPGAPPLSGWASILRKISQAYQLVCSADFLDDARIYAKTARRYDEEDEVRFYAEFARHGLIEEEKLALERVRPLLASSASSTMQPLPAPRVLVLGCGAGREAFALAEMGFEVVAIDSSPRMIEMARKMAHKQTDSRASEAQFICGVLPASGFTEAKFDLVWVTYNLLNHIPQSKNRISLLKECAKLVHEQGAILTHADEFDFSSDSKLSFASRVLKWRWRNQDRWQKGDTLKANLGPHSTSGSLIYYHYYPSSEAVAAEARGAGLFPVRRGLSWFFFKSEKLAASV